MAKEDRNKDTRRHFLKRLGLVSLGAAGSSLVFLDPKEKLESKPGESINVLTTDNKVVQVDASQTKDISTKSKPKKQVSDDVLDERGREGLPGKHFVMVIDLAKCRNARKCMKACQKAHQLKPEQHHINVLTLQDEHTDKHYFLPKPCMHCDEPQCVTVCPVDATFKRQDGIVLIDNERCIGCRFCIAACPYSARSFNWSEPKKTEKFKDAGYNVELNVPQKKGTVTKCAFSADRLRDNRLPYCVSACPNGVYYFGDANEDLVTNGTTLQTVRLSKLLKENAAYTLLPELNTKPNVYYLPHKTNKNLNE